MEYDRIYSIRKGEYFADALKRAGKDFIPTNCIINKLLPGLGATHCELTAPRKSIIIEPNVPVIESKAKVHKNSLAIYKGDRKSTRLNSSHYQQSRMPSSA